MSETKTETASSADTLKESIEAQRKLDAAVAMAQTVSIIAAAQTAVDAIEPRLISSDRVPAERQLFSLGNCCQMFQSPPSLIRAYAQAAGVEVAWCINDIPHFDGAGVVAIGRWIRQNVEKQ